MIRRRVALILLAVAACASRGAGGASRDGGREAAPVDAPGAPEGGGDAYVASDASGEAAVDAGLLAAPIVRLANFSPDAPAVDLCLAERGSGAWVGPILGQAEAAGVRFPGESPYVPIVPGLYDVRIVASGGDCTTPLFSDVTDLPGLVPGTHATLAAVGDLQVLGTDPAIGLALFADDTVVTPGKVRLRFLNAVPSATDVSLVVERAGVLVPLIAAPFGDVGVDSDAGTLDPADYVALPPVAGATWLAVEYGGTGPVLASAYGVNIAPGTLATVVTVGGESGPDEPDVGLLLCLDTPPIVAGARAVCTLLGGTLD